MKLIVTTFSNTGNLLGGQITIEGNFYIASQKLAGSVVMLKKDDDWLDGELAWVSRSEIPFITAIRLSQVSDDPNGNIWGRDPTPIITKWGSNHGAFYLSKQADYKYFPTEQECLKLLSNESKNLNLNYALEHKTLNSNDISSIYHAFDYENDLLIRAGACLHKAHTLERTSYIFSEEIYVNLYIAFEAIVEYLSQAKSMSRKRILEAIGGISGTNSFLEYEEEMRDDVRNNIVHPWRKKYQETIVQPMIDVDYVFEDLPFVDWLFKMVLLDHVT